MQKDPNKQTPREKKQHQRSTMKPHNLHLWSEREFSVMSGSFSFNEFEDSYGNMPGSRQGLTRQYAPESDTESVFGNYQGAQSGHHGKGPKNFRRRDESILDDICLQLFFSDEIDASNIEVSVENGVTTLVGTVSTSDMKSRTESLVRSIFGVTRVLSTLRTDRPGANAS